MTHPELGVVVVASTLAAASVFVDAATDFLFVLVLAANHLSAVAAIGLVAVFAVVTESVLVVVAAFDSVVVVVVVSTAAVRVAVEYFVALVVVAQLGPIAVALVVLISID